MRKVIINKLYLKISKRQLNRNTKLSIKQRLNKNAKSNYIRTRKSHFYGYVK